MFYPVLLYRDFGVASWFIFTIPNVIGAALVPWFIKDAQSSEDFIRQHPFACKFFSVVTILFNLYFLIWVLVLFEISPAIILFILLAFIIVFVASQRRILTVSLLVFFISLFALLLIFVFAQETGLTIVREGKYGIREALGLIPVFLIGFFLCPFLDLTFHRVIKDSRQSQIKLVFIIGFLIMFLSFLVLGIKYYPIIYHVLLGANDQPKTGVFLAVCIYVIIQTSFTLILHLDELLKQKPPRSLWILLICLSICVSVYAVFANSEITLLGEPVHLREALYRGFLSIYGLLAPIYIWMFVVMKFGKSQQYVISNRRWFIWTIAVLLALPFYVIGFYGNLKWVIFVLPIGVLIALLTPIKSVIRLALRLFFTSKQLR